MDNNNSEKKIVNSALTGSVGSVMLFLITAFILDAAPDASNMDPNPASDPAFGQIVLPVLLAMLSAVIFWFSGLIAIARLLISNSSYKTSPKAIVSYFFIGIPIMYIFLAMLIGAIQ